MCLNFKSDVWNKSLTIMTILNDYISPLMELRLFVLVGQSLTIISLFIVQLNFFN
jgi:hypothetical protein